MFGLSVRREASRSAVGHNLVCSYEKRPPAWPPRPARAQSGARRPLPALPREAELFVLPHEDLSPRTAAALPRVGASLRRRGLGGRRIPRRIGLVLLRRLEGRRRRVLDLARRGRVAAGDGARGAARCRVGIVGIRRLAGLGLVGVCPHSRPRSPSFAPWRRRPIATPVRPRAGRVLAVPDTGPGSPAPGRRRRVPAGLPRIALRRLPPGPARGWPGRRGRCSIRGRRGRRVWGRRGDRLGDRGLGRRGRRDAGREQDGQLHAGGQDGTWWRPQRRQDPGRDGATRPRSWHAGPRRGRPGSGGPERAPGGGRRRVR